MVQIRVSPEHFCVIAPNMLRKHNFSPMINICLYSSVAERWSCKPKVMSSILIGGTKSFDLNDLLAWFKTAKQCWPRRDSNTQPSDLESDALPLRHGVNQVPPRFELGSLDSKSRVLTITPWNPVHSYPPKIFLTVSCRVRTGDLVRVKHTW